MIIEHTILTGKTEWKRPCVRPQYRWENNVEMDFTEIGFEDGDLICLPRKSQPG
jgi:hypothetical protein